MTWLLLLGLGGFVVGGLLGVAWYECLDNRWDRE